MSRPVNAGHNTCENADCRVKKDLDNREHQLNSICWARDARTGDPLVIVANDVQKIKVLSVKTGKLVRTLIGHGSAVNDLIICPTDPNILASCSMDYTIRIWNLSPEFESHPCVAMCAGEGHREGLLGIAWHHSGRYLLSGGHDTVVNLWAIPDLPDKPTDDIAMIFHPHFSSNEVHWNYVDCVQWYGDQILSRAVGENKVCLWQIDDFEPSKYTGENALPQAPGPSMYKPSFTRSAFGAGFTRLLTFEVKFSSLFYMRFGLFHQPGKHPILCAGNERSKVHFWDLQQLEEGPPGPTPSLRWAGHAKKSISHPSLNGDVSEASGRAATLFMEDDEDYEPDPRGDDGFRKPRMKKRDADLFPSIARLSLHRSNSAHSDAGSSHVTESTDSVVPQELMPRKAGRKSKEDPKVKYGIDDPFRELQPHKAIVVPKVGFCVRQVAWSVGGEWCVACGDNGMIALFSRWMKE